MAIATLRAVTLRAVKWNRHDMVCSRTQLINRLHAVMVRPVSSGLPRGLTAEAAPEALRRIRPRDTLRPALRTIAVDLVVELRRLDRRIGDASQTLIEAVTASGTTLTDLLGIGDVVAAKILARTGPISRFPTPGLACGRRGVSRR